MTHSCTAAGCTVSMRTAHRRAHRRPWPAWLSYVVGVALTISAGAVLLGVGLGGVL